MLFFSKMNRGSKICRKSDLQVPNGGKILLNLNGCYQKLLDRTAQTVRLVTWTRWTRHSHPSICGQDTYENPRPFLPPVQIYNMIIQFEKRAIRRAVKRELSRKMMWDGLHDGLACIWLAGSMQN